MTHRLTRMRNVPCSTHPPLLPSHPHSTQAGRPYFPPSEHGPVKPPQQSQQQSFPEQWQPRQQLQTQPCLHLWGGGPDFGAPGFGTWRSLPPLQPLPPLPPFPPLSATPIALSPSMHPMHKLSIQIQSDHCTATCPTSLTCFGNLLLPLIASTFNTPHASAAYFSHPSLTINPPYSYLYILTSVLLLPLVSFLPPDARQRASPCS